MPSLESHYIQKFDSLAQDAKTNQTRWTIHQPARKGWYIRLRSPLFPPGACIALTPPSFHAKPAHSPAQPRSTSGAPQGSADDRTGRGTGMSGSVNTTFTGAGEPVLIFGCQTLVPSSISASTSTGEQGGGAMSNRSSVDHSYPPSTPSQTRSPSSTSQQLTEGTEITSAAQRTPSSPPRQPPRPAPRWHVTHYTLQTGIPATGVLAGTHHHPHLIHPDQHVHQPSFLQRALAPLSYLASSSGINTSAYNFTIQPAAAPPVASGSTSSPDPKASTTNPNPSETTTVGGHVSAAADSSSLLPSSPFVAFTDNTPILRATPSGTLSVDAEKVRTLGVEMTFWVAVALAFWEFLREREVRLFFFLSFFLLPMVSLSRGFHGLAHVFSFLLPFGFCSLWCSWWALLTLLYIHRGISLLQMTEDCIGFIVSLYSLFGFVYCTGRMQLDLETIEFPFSHTASVRTTSLWYIIAYQYFTSAAVEVD